MTEWFAAAPVLLAAAGFTYLPGLLVGAGLRLRGLPLLALAPVGSTAILSAMAVLYGWTSVRWTPITAIVGVAILAAIAWLLGTRLGDPARPVRSGRGMLVVVGLLIGGLLGAIRFAVYIGEPTAVSQTNDAVFHLNALRWILESGSASSLDVSGVTGGTTFYPAAWHAITSLAALGDPAAIPVAANMTSLLLPALVWPTSIAWLTQVATRGQRYTVAATALAGALSAALLTFPLLMLQWGVLYPFALAGSLVPAVVAMTVALPTWAEGVESTGRRRWTFAVGILLLAAGVGALALAQPSAILVWALLATCWVVFRWGARLVHRGERLRSAAVIVFASLALGGLWYLLARSTSGSHWPPFRGKLEAIGDVLLNAPLLLPPAWLVSVLMFAGIAVALRDRRLRWLVLGWVALGGLYAVAAAIGNPLLRRWLLGPWYADPYRLGALLPVVVIPLAAIGLAAVLTWLARRAGAGSSLFAWLGLLVVGVVGALVLVLQPVMQMPKVIEGEWDAQSRYAANDESFLSPDERALLERLDERVPADARVIGNPGAGTGFGYFLSGRDVYPRTWAPPRSATWDVLAGRLHDVAEDPEVCQALDAFGDPEFVLDFGAGEQSPGRYLMPGFTDFADRDGFTLVDQEGDASLWRITACSP